MARGVSPLLTSPTPFTTCAADVTIGHVQLRDVLICPHESGVVTYPSHHSIVEHDLLASPHPNARQLADVGFTPNSLCALKLPNSEHTLLAAGGQEAELYLALWTSQPSRTGRRGFGSKLWDHKYIVERASINNSVLLTSLSLTESHQSSAEPRVIISNNDKTVKFFDIAVRRSKGFSQTSRLSTVGQLHLDVPVNHSSISPDGRTLLCVGDSPDVYLHRISGSSRITVSPISTLSLSPYISSSSSYSSFSSGPSSATAPASFCTAFSSDGSKFAVASQEGVVVVWDVRSTKPLKVFQTDKTRTSAHSSVDETNAWMYEGPWDWSRSASHAPGWGVRSVKFSPAGVGREVLTFTEHTNLLHVIDARTFEKEEIVRMPAFEAPPQRPRSVSPGSTRSSTHAIEAPPPPPRMFLFSGALEETFRIPSDTSTHRRARLGSRRVRSRDDISADDDVDGIVVIPPLGDRQVENDVRRLLGRHGMRTRGTVLDSEQLREDAPGDGDPGDGVGEDEMDVDELESDCFSSHTSSRAGSPAPVPAQQASSGTRPDYLRAMRTGVLARRESAGPYAMPRRPSGLSRRHWRSSQVEDTEDQDLAGTCFDPTGACVYVASSHGIAEWTVRGAEQRWWTDPSWA
ncbi:hypothetical protein WOLCODRAFT_137703 [Wolfiporia cocos MD-104 SS10]|uniref:DUF2415 domain-containing protein n=1 Tax=Wolfiporia cocos (strain MD-104) TaxID=742152 RepID=A0A2H3JW89_WOLCO|nr:hypothetical protein WOLCODRAFT_137703 [Wolfiporia cocos MD-104 SS10]